MADDTEVARYVVGYLLQNSYSQTMQAFLQECKQLNGATITILPSTSLKEIIREHVTRRSATQMVNSLGSMSSWQLLWQQLQHTLTQINTLAEDVIGDSQRSRPTGKSRSRRSTHLPKPPLVITPQPASSPSIVNRPPTTPSLLSTPSSSSGHVTTATDDMTLKTRSPRKSKQPRRSVGLLQQERMAAPLSSPESTALPVTSCSSLSPSDTTASDVQHILNVLMSNQALPERLAGLINQYADTSLEGASHSAGSSSSMEQLSVHQPSQEPSLLSQTTLDSILDITCADPWLEELLASDPPPLPPPIAAPSPTSCSTAPCHPLPVSTHSLFEQPPQTVVAGETRKRPRAEQHDEEELARSKLCFPPGMNVEAFLDRLHSKQ